MAVPGNNASHLARVHFDTAVALVGSAQVRAWLGAENTAPVPAPVPAALPSTSSSSSSGRGRKAGTVANAEERCTWTLVDGSQCKNRHQPSAAYCKIHLKNIHLVDDTAAAAAAAAAASGSATYDD